MKQKIANKLSKTYFKSLKTVSKKKYGFSNTECWSLDITIAAFTLPRLVYLRDHSQGVPDSIYKKILEKQECKNIDDAIKLWKKTLDSMIEAFAVYLKNYGVPDEDNRNDREKWEVGFKNFTEHFSDLWGYKSPDKFVF